MRFGLISRPGMLIVLAMLLIEPWESRAQLAYQAAGRESALSIPQAQVIQPEELNHMLAAKEEKPLILQVGSHVLFAESHIKGAEYAGPGSQAAGLNLLQQRVQMLSRKTLIVLYCGCCPWNRCPNLGPAFWQLNDMGFTRVKVLYLADNFGADWVNKGYAVEQGR